LADQIVRNLKIKHNKHNNESSAIILLFNNISLPPSPLQTFYPPSSTTQDWTFWSDTSGHRSNFVKS